MSPPTQTDDLMESRSSKPAIQTGAMWGTTLVFLGLAMVGATAYRFTALKEWLQPAGQAATWVRETGFWGAATFLLGTSVFIIMGVPRLLFCPLAGALFGFWGGLSVSIGGTMVSYYTAFRVIRGRRAKGEGSPPLSPSPKLAFLAGQPTLTAVTVSRMLPVPGMIVTLALSMSNVHTGTYLVGSLLGLIPDAAPLILLGAGTLHPGAERPVKLVISAFVCILVAWVAIQYLVRRFRNADRS